MWELTDVVFGRGGSGEVGGICAAVSCAGPADGSVSSLRAGAAAEDEDEDDEAVVTGASGAGEAGDCNTDRDDDHLMTTTMMMP